MIDALSCAGENGVVRLRSDGGDVQGGIQVVCRTVSLRQGDAGSGDGAAEAGRGSQNGWGRYN